MKKRSLSVTTCLNLCHLSVIRDRLYWKKFSNVKSKQLSETTSRILAALSWASFDTPIVLISMNFVIFPATSLYLTSAQLHANKIIIIDNKSISSFGIVNSVQIYVWKTYPIQEPAWLVHLEMVNTITSWFAGELIEVYCGQ